MINMLIHNFKYALKILFRSRMLIFWTFAFPIILGTFFNMAFSNIENSEKLEIINIAIVKNEEFENNEMIREAFQTLSDEQNKERLFNTQYVTEEEAKELLENDEITGYLVFQDTPKVTIKANGINETILKQVTEEIAGNSEMINNLLENEMKKEMLAGNRVDYEKIVKSIVEMVQQENVTIRNISNHNLSYTMIEFYTLIAMTCLYGGVLGMVAINQNLANMSSTRKTSFYGSDFKRKSNS